MAKILSLDIYSISNFFQGNYKLFSYLLDSYSIHNILDKYHYDISDSIFNQSINGDINYISYFPKHSVLDQFTDFENLHYNMYSLVRDSIISDKIR